MGKNNHSRRLPNKEELISNQLRKKPMTKQQLADETGLRVCVVDTTIKNNHGKFIEIIVDGRKKWTLV